jgi:hypothetical protein
MLEPLHGAPVRIGELGGRIVGVPALNPTEVDQSVVPGRIGNEVSNFHLEYEAEHLARNCRDSAWLPVSKSRGNCRLELLPRRAELREVTHLVPANSDAVLLQEQ